MRDEIVHGDKVPNAAEFEKEREDFRALLGNDTSLRSKAISLFIEADKYKFGYQWEWLGIPIIRHPDDIVLQQEIMFKVRPSSIIETGVARGGSLALSASLMKILDIEPYVLGIDLKILDHAHNSLKNYTSKGEIQLIESDSTDQSLNQVIDRFISKKSGICLAILDSNHTHQHVLAELELISPHLPVGSIVIVADTIVEEMPQNYYSNRPWNVGDNPKTAVDAFLAAHPEWQIDKTWSKRSLLGECRDGIIRRIG
jgi:cephalosporin hydroxylase